MTTEFIKLFCRTHDVTVDFSYETEAWAYNSYMPEITCTLTMHSFSSGRQVSHRWITERITEHDLNKAVVSMYEYLKKNDDFFIMSRVSSVSGKNSLTIPYSIADIEEEKRYFFTKNVRSLFYIPNVKIKKVIFNNPATIVFWEDGSKTVVKCQDDDEFDKMVGLSMAISKKALGNKGNYYNEFKKWIDKEEN